jgi:DNA polymerase I
VWILDSAYRDGGIDLWTKDGGTVAKVHHAYDPPFFVSFHDPTLHYVMISALEEGYSAEECTIRTIFGERPGYAVCAGREIAEAIEKQAQFGADLFNVDVRRDQRFMAEHSIFPCTHDGTDRFSPRIEHDLSVMEVTVHGNPALLPAPSCMDIAGERNEHLTGEAKIVAGDFLGLVDVIDPDVILMTDADLWMPKIRTLAKKEGLEMNLSRNGKYRQMSSRSYWSYGRIEHKEAALVPDGRILIDTEQSFVFREGGLDGVLMASRLSGLPPNMASRLTPGTLISSYETYEALKWGIAVPFRKSDPEQVRKLSELKAADRGGLMFQPKPGIYENVEEIDYTSMYPSIIVNANLSPETVGHPERAGFLPAVLRPLLELRIQTKRLKKTDPGMAGIDSVLKWMLVTCFGYTGYKNAKFGRIEVHEGITGRSRDILIRTRDIAEELNFTVLHGIVDCLWVQGAPIESLKEQVERETGMFLEVEHFDWIVFLPMADGFGAYNRYYGRQPDGSIKVRGIAARRHDTPEYVRGMQDGMLRVMARARTIAELNSLKGEVAGIFRDTMAAIPAADPKQMAIERRISRTSYRHQCLEAAAVRAYLDHGVEIEPGMKIEYVVTNARRYCVEPKWCAKTFDIQYYQGQLEKAWGEIQYALGSRFPENRGVSTYT